jgi:hypothetical protein
MGSMTVLFAGKPAARVGDMTAHGGAIMPPGFPTVLIGDMGAGSGTAAAATMANARATAAAFTRTDCAAQGAAEKVKDSPFRFEGDPAKKSWVEIELVDQKGKPVPHERYRVIPPDKKPIEGFLDEKGFARVTGIDPGTCQITFPNLDAAAWKPQSGDPGRRTRPEVDPSFGRPSVGPVVVRELFFGRPSVGPVKAAIATLTRPSVGPVKARVTTPSVGPVTVKLAQPKARFVTQIPGVRDGMVLLVRGRDGRELKRTTVASGSKKPAFIDLPLDEFLTEGLLNLEITLSNGKIINGFSFDFDALRAIQLAGADVDQFAQALALGLTSAITARDDV